MIRRRRNVSKSRKHHTTRKTNVGFGTKGRRTTGHKGMRAWTRTEVTTLRKIYRTNSNDFIAKKLGRSEGSVQYKASSLGLRKSATYLRQIRNNWC